MGDKGSGRRIFDKSMDTRITIRLDEKHIKIIENIMSKKEIKTKAEAIRFIIEEAENNK